MEQEGPSFWADIKKYEDTLDRDPNSYCFAPLSELYRKLGMVDDAIIIAKRGCELHPEYVGGYMALGRAYFEKGMSGECRQALEKVVRVTPDNLLAQRILAQIYIDAGEVGAAGEALTAILAQNPDDTESRILLNSLTRLAGASAHPAAFVEDGKTMENRTAEIGEVFSEYLQEEDNDDIIDLLESDIVEEFTEEAELEEELPYASESDNGYPDIFSGVEMERKDDPLRTVTLAELYVSQGLIEQGMAIYKELLQADPGNAELESRLVALEKDIHKNEENAGDPSFKAVYSAREAVALAEETFIDEPLQIESGGGFCADELLPAGGLTPARNEEHIIHVLEMWLENIRRMR